MLIEKRYLPANIEKGKGANQVNGLAIKWNSLSQPIWGYKEKIEPFAFTESIEKNNIKCFFNHNYDIIFSSTENKTLQILEDNTGLKFNSNIPETQQGLDTLKLIELNEIKGVSVGFYLEDWEKDQTWDDVKKIRSIKKASLVEISITHSPAYLSTKVAINRNLNEDDAILKHIYIKNQNIIRNNLIKNQGVI